jgi:hypothetical protein
VPEDENCDLLTDFNSIFNRWMKQVCWLLNACRVTDVRQTEIKTNGPLVSEPSSLRLRLLMER